MTGAASRDRPAPRFTRGVGGDKAGFRLAFAFPDAPDRAPNIPDRTHWWVEGPDGWKLLDLQALADRANLRLPPELTDDYFDLAYADQIAAAGRFLVRLSTLSPSPQPPPEAPRFWWLND